MSVQAIANVIPFTPGGAGAQQALLVATLTGPSRTAVLSFSVGTQIAMAAWSVLLGFAAILLVFRTTDWRGLIQQAQDDGRRRHAASSVGQIALLFGLPASLPGDAELASSLAYGDGASGSRPSQLPLEA